MGEDATKQPDEITFPMKRIEENILMHIQRKNTRDGHVREQRHANGYPE